MACSLLWSSAVRVNDSQAYRKMDVTRERISRILELRGILLSFQTVSAAVACAILESISGLEPSSDTTEPRYFDLFIDAAGVVIKVEGHLQQVVFTSIVCCLQTLWSYIVHS